MFSHELQTLSGKKIPLQIEDRMYIGGDFISTDETFESEHPPTHEILAKVPIATSEHVDEAVAAASRASTEWDRYDSFERREVMESFAEFILDHSAELTNIEVADNGSTIARMQYDVEKFAKKIRHIAGIAHELKGESIPTGPDSHDFTLREPYGVIAGIIPFNHPAMFVAEKIAPAIAAGNGIVIKPSEYTSLSALYIGHLLDEFGEFPPGLINIITGFAETGAALVEHEGVGLINMVGSPQTATAVMQGAATHLSPVILELGGKNPFIVFPDAETEEVVNGLENAMALPWQGQSCGSGTRLLIHDEMYDAVVPEIVERVQSLAIGDPFDKSSEMGSMVSEPQFKKVLHYINVAKEEGASLLTGGKRVAAFNSGYFVEPTIFEVEPGMTIAQEETFGPVLSVLRWSSYEEMIEIANDIPYGLTASVWTTDLDSAHRTVDEIEAGYVWVNQHGEHFLGAPFGGYKKSGIGQKENLHELLEHTRVKNVNFNFSEK